MRLVHEPTGHELDLLPTTSVGRAPDNDIQLASRSVSRRHAQLIVQPGQVTVIDLNSLAGTYVNGTKIAEPTVMRPGDTIRIASVTLTLSV